MSGAGPPPVENALATHTVRKALVGMIRAEITDQLGLGIAFTNTAPVCLIHPEHGGKGVAPGTWLVRRQREAGARRRQGFGVVQPMLVAD